jgi:nicotinamidase-related amidase
MGLASVEPAMELEGTIHNHDRKYHLMDQNDRIVLEIHPTVGPQDEEIIVVKHRVGAFAGTDLEMILGAKDIDTLVLFGFATSGVALSTLRYAADLGYRCVVIKGCCADRDAEVHNCLTEKVFPRHANVGTAKELLRTVRS